MASNLVGSLSTATTGDDLEAFLRAFRTALARNI